MTQVGKIRNDLASDIEIQTMSKLFRNNLFLYSAFSKIGQRDFTGYFIVGQSEDDGSDIMLESLSTLPEEFEFFNTTNQYVNSFSSNDYFIEGVYDE